MDNISNKMFAGILTVWLLVILASGAGFAALIYVAYHFISKLW